VLKGLWLIQDPGKKEETIGILAKWLKADRPLAQNIYEIAKDSWTKTGMATEKAMGLSLAMSRIGLKTKQELSATDMYDSSVIKRLNAQLESAGWRP
jgi:hypothetical protein